MRIIGIPVTLWLGMEFMLDRRWGWGVSFLLLTVYLLVRFFYLLTKREMELMEERTSFPGTMST